MGDIREWENLANKELNRRGKKSKTWSLTQQKVLRSNRCIPPVTLMG